MIRRRHILAHPVVTIQSFGWRVFLRSILSGRGRTFLSVVAECEAFVAPEEEASGIVDRCARLELRAARLYDALARRFSQARAASEFFAALARQEEEHADLLRLCGAASTGARWDARLLRSCAEEAPRLERAMEVAESQASRIRAVSDALRLALRIESSEVNHVFEDIIAASDSAFVRAVDAFRRAVGMHLDYICRRAPEIDPGAREGCETLSTHRPHSRGGGGT